MPYPQDLVSVDLVKQHLRLASDFTAEDDLIGTYILHATAAIVDYITRDDDDWIAEIAAWTEDTVPPPVQAAILLQVAEIYRFRGDEDGPNREIGFVSPQIRALLMPYRDPTIA